MPSVSNGPPAVPSRRLSLFSPPLAFQRLPQHSHNEHLHAQAHPRLPVRACVRTCVCLFILTCLSVFVSPPVHVDASLIIRVLRRCHALLTVSGTRSTSVNSSGPLDAFPFMLSPRRMGRAHSEGVGAHFPSDVFPAGQVGSSGSILHLYRSLNAFAAPPVHREPPFYASSGGSTTSSSGDADELANGIPLPLNITPTQSAAHSCERSPGPRRGADTVQVAPVHTTVSLALFLLRIVRVGLVLCTRRPCLVAVVCCVQVEEESNGSARASLLPQWNPLDQNSPRDSVNEETGGSPDSAIAASHVFAAPIVSADGAFATSVAGCITGCNVEVPSLSPPDPEVPQGPQGLQRWAPTQLRCVTHFALDL